MQVKPSAQFSLRISFLNCVIRLRNETAARNAAHIHAELETQRDDAKAARDGFLTDAQDAELRLAPIVLGEAHTSKRRVNPRLLAWSKAEKTMPLLMDAIELSKLPDAP